MTFTEAVRPLLLALFALLLALPARAQEEDPDRPVLPDIAPREVEIRGQLEIALPSLQRQPLIGFNPPPRLAEIPAGRRPYVEPYKQEKAELPRTPLSRPEPPEVSALAGKDPAYGEFEASAGRYFTRLVRARTGLPITPQATFHGRLDYRGTDGHAPFDERPDVTTSYDLLSGRAGFELHRARLRAGLEVDGFFDRYTLYGAEVDAGDVIQLPDPEPTRTGQGAGGALWLRTQGSGRTAVLQTRVRYGATRYETNVFDEAPGGRFERLEHRIDAEADLGVPVAPGDVLLGARLARSSFEDDDEAFLLEGGLGLRLSTWRSFRATLGARFLGFSALYDRGEAAETETQRGYLSPEVRLELYPAQGVRLYLQNQPAGQAPALAELYQIHPYLVDEPRLQPSLHVVDAEGGASFFLGPAQLVARAGYQQVPNYLFFEPAGTAVSGGYARGLWATHYAEATVVHAGGDLSVVLPAGFHATVGGTYREGRLTEEDTAIPYFGPVVGQAVLSYVFSRSRGLLQLVGTYESARYTDRTETDRVGAFFDVDVLAAYNFTPAIGLITRIENISAGALERWEGYPQAPWVVTGGLRIRW